MGFSKLELQQEQDAPLNKWGIADVEHLIHFTSSDMLDLGLPIAPQSALANGDVYIDQSILIEGFNGQSNPIAQACAQQGLSFTSVFDEVDGLRYTCHTFEIEEQGVKIPRHLISISKQDAKGHWLLEGLYADSTALYLKILGLKSQDLNPDQDDNKTQFINVAPEVFTEDISGITPFDKDPKGRAYFAKIVDENSQLQLDVQRNHVTIENTHYAKKSDLISKEHIENHSLDTYDQTMPGPFYSRLYGKWILLQTKLQLENPPRIVNYKIVRDSKVVFYKNNAQEKRGVIIEKLYIDEEVSIDNNFVIEHNYYRVPGYIKSEILFDEQAQRYLIENTQMTEPQALEMHNHFESYENLDKVLKLIGAKKENTQEKIERFLDSNPSIFNAFGQAGFRPIQIDDEHITHINTHPLRDILAQENPSVSTEATSIRREIGGVNYLIILENNIHFAALSTGRHERFEVVSVFREEDDEEPRFEGMFATAGWQDFVEGMLAHPHGVGSPMQRVSLSIPKAIESEAYTKYMGAIAILKRQSSSGGDTVEDFVSYFLVELGLLETDFDTYSDGDFAFLEMLANKTVGLLNGASITEYQALFKDDHFIKFDNLFQKVKDIVQKKQEESTVVGQYKKVHFDIHKKVFPITPLSDNPFSILESLLIELHNLAPKKEELELLKRVMELSVTRVETPEKDILEYIELMNEISAKSDYQNNPLLSILLGILVVTCLASLAMMVPQVSAFVLLELGFEMATAYYVVPVLVSGVGAMVAREKIKRWSPLYDAMKPVSELTAANTPSTPSTPSTPNRSRSSTLSTTGTGNKSILIY